MKLLFRRKHDGRILKPIQTLDSYVRLQNAAGNRVWWAKKDKLPENFDVLTHDIERGDVLRDIRDGSMWIVEYVGLHGLRMQNRKDGVAGMTYFGLINYERVGRKYCLRDRKPHGVRNIQAPWNHGAPDQVAHVVAVVSGYDRRSNIRSRPIIRVGVERRRKVVHFRLIMQA